MKKVNFGISEINTYLVDGSEIGDVSICETTVYDITQDVNKDLFLVGVCVPHWYATKALSDTVKDDDRGLMAFIGFFQTIVYQPKQKLDGETAEYVLDYGINEGKEFYTLYVSGKVKMTFGEAGWTNYPHEVIRLTYSEYGEDYKIYVNGCDVSFSFERSIPISYFDNKIYDIVYDN